MTNYRRNEYLGVPLFDSNDFRVISFFFNLILTRRPGYLYADLIGARFVRTSNFIFPSVSPGASVLVRAIRYSFYVWATPDPHFNYAQFSIIPNR
jgi:hypothetical protein